MERRQQHLRLILIEHQQQTQQAIVGPLGVRTVHDIKQMGALLQGILDFFLYGMSLFVYETLPLRIKVGIIHGQPATRPLA